MAKYSAETRKRLVINAIQATLVDFGYSTLTADQTEKAIKQAIKGETESNVIAGFIARWLEDEDILAQLKPEIEQLFKEEAMSGKKKPALE